MAERGRFIVVEGLEGAGKSTAIKTIKHYIETATAHKLILTREPGGTRIGEAVRHLVKEKEKIPGEKLDYRSELLLMYAARVQLVEQVIRPALERGDWVIADRFELSTYAYQGGGRGINKSIIEQLSKICLQGFKPDLMLFLDISPEQGMKRVKRRGKIDRFEQEELSFFSRVYLEYHEQIKSMENVAIIKASKPLHIVQTTITEHLQHFIEHYGTIKE